MMNLGKRVKSALRLSVNSTTSPATGGMLGPHAGDYPQGFTIGGRGNGWVDKRTSLTLFLLVFFCYSYFLPALSSEAANQTNKQDVLEHLEAERDGNGEEEGGWVGTDNEKSRLALIAAVVEHHRLDIDADHAMTGDKAWHDGHYYSDKAIGTAVLGVPVYAAYREIRGFEHFARKYWKPNNPFHILTVTVVALPSALLSVVLYQLGRLMGTGRAWALLLTLLYAFGTLAFPFSTVFFGHQLAAAFAFAAFFFLVRARLETSSGPTSAWSLLAAGALAGIAVLGEYPVALVAAFLFLYAATFVRPKHRLGLYVLGGLPAAALLLAYNWQTMGSPLSFAYEHVSQPEFEEMKDGFFGITQPSWSSFVEITIGPRGLLRQSVFLWLMPLGVWLMCRKPGWRREWALCVGVGLAFMVWNSGYYLPLGGDTPGARFLVPSLPFLIVPLFFLARETGVLLHVTKAVVLLAGVWSVSLYFLATSVRPLLRENITDPVRDFWLPALSTGKMRANLGQLLFGLRGVESLMPLAVVIAVMLAALVLLSRGSGVRPTHSVKKDG